MTGRQRHLARLFAHGPPGHQQAGFRVQHAFHVFAHGHETLAAARAQVRNDPGQIVHRAFVRVVKKKDAAQRARGIGIAPRAAQFGVVRRQAFPVAAVQGPEYHGKAQRLGGFHGVVVKRAVGRPQEKRRGPQGTQNGVGTADFLVLALR